METLEMRASQDPEVLKVFLEFLVKKAGMVPQETRVMRRVTKATPGCRDFRVPRGCRVQQGLLVSQVSRACPETGERRGPLVLMDTLE